VLCEKSPRKQPAAISEIEMKIPNLPVAARRKNSSSGFNVLAIRFRTGKVGRVTGNNQSITDEIEKQIGIRS